MPSTSPPGTVSPWSRVHFNNWISAIGGVIGIGALFSFALLTWMDFTQGDTNPYLGIFTYIVAPGFLILGIGLGLFGAWAQRRWQIKHAATAPQKWQLNFSDPRQRRRLILFGCGGLAFVMLSAFGSYQTYHYSESTQFCGQVCHSATNPEWVNYQRSRHARVDCARCHIGSGPQYYVKAKINGVQHLIVFVLDRYNRPIPTPAKSMRPAKDTCEKCHWPEKSEGNVVLSFNHFLSDKANTAYGARMLYHVNQSAPGGPPGGIHWHASPTTRVEYYPADERRQEIPWFRVTDTKAGTSQVYRTEKFTGEPPADKIRVMDCIDCHNRPAHQFPTANDSVEKAMFAGRISQKLPNIKRVAVQAMTQEKLTSTASAPELIETFIRSKYTDAAVAGELPGTIAAVKDIFATSIFIERKADWREYPNNLGHKDWPGCFRCHDEKHKNPEGKPVRSGCTLCHTLLGQGTGEALQTFTAKGVEFKHPGGELDPELTCSDCHNGGIQK